MTAQPHFAISRGTREWVAALGETDHSVQFYESDDYLCNLVAMFVADGLKAGEPAIIVATEAHRKGFAAALHSMGIDPDDARIAMLDARETLRQFMNGAVPDPERFRAAVGSVLEERTGGDARVRIRAYGEMVDLLWRDENPAAAVRLEEMWNELTGFYRFTLLCAYPMANFHNESHSRMFEEVCRTHTRVMPSELFEPVVDDTRAREIALLQQRAGALEAEVQHRKDLEAALRESLAAHRANEERLAFVAAENARLYRIASNANHAKDEFLATLSHELRTPLTAILGWARMLEIGGLDPDIMRTAVKTIDRSARAQALLIDDLLDVSAIAAGKLSLRSDVVDLAEVVERAVETLRLAAETREIRVDMQAARGRAIITGDAARLQQVVWNLLSNAVKFSEVGSRVSIAVERDEQQAYITVHDDGCGIPPEFLPHVFHPFRQADGTSTREYGGLGLGLAIVKHVVELHGGSVNATSPGRGSGATFLVTLPLAS